MKQEQFLDVATLPDARARWLAALDVTPKASVVCSLREAHGRVLAEDIIAPGDVPAFDRSNVDGFAVQAADTFGASERSPVRLALTGTPIDAGMAPEGEVGTGEARVLATGGVVPRGADAVVMVEHTEVEDGVVLVSKPVAPGGRISHAGSDVGRGETILRAGTVLTARETGTLAACGIDRVPCVGPLRVAILSTGDEIVPPGRPLAPGEVHDANATLLADTLRELGAEPTILGIAGDEEEALRAHLAQARDYDAALLSGGTSKGGGDLSYRVLEEMAQTIVHGVALKPGKPLCLSVWDKKPVVVLPGFPTSAIFTFHAVVAPVLLRMMGRSKRHAPHVTATLSRHTASERGRHEFNLVNLVQGREGWMAFPLGKGSGSVTTFARADGFFELYSDQEYAEAGESVQVTLLGRDVQPADLVIVGSHCPGIDRVLSELARTTGYAAKVLAVGSRGGIDAAREGACDIAPVHLFDAERGRWNEPFLPEGTRLLPGYVRRQGIACRAEHAARFDGTLDDAIRAVVAEGSLRIANRNRASGTYLLLEALLGGAPTPTPAGWSSAYRSHNAVASAVHQGRADWGVCIESAARDTGLVWLPWRDEHLAFVVPEERWDSRPVRAFREMLESSTVRDHLRVLGMQP